MAAQELLKRGNEAFVDEEYSTALDLYSKVICWAGLSSSAGLVWHTSWNVKY